MDVSIVENWLRSLGMVQYTQSFIDNGYDDLEVCKQIGDADLDAIGVTKESHRKTILEAVNVLLKYGGARVYFTLDPEYQRLKALQSEAKPDPKQDGPWSKDIVNGVEETSFMHDEPSSLMDNGDIPHLHVHNCLNGFSKLDNERVGLSALPPVLQNMSPAASQPPCGPPPSFNTQTHCSTSTHSSLVTFSKLQLTAIIQDKLSEDGINLENYGNQEPVSTHCSMRELNTECCCNATKCAQGNKPIVTSKFADGPREHMCTSQRDHRRESTWGSCLTDVTEFTRVTAEEPHNWGHCMRVSLAWHLHMSVFFQTITFLANLRFMSKR